MRFQFDVTLLNSRLTSLDSTAINELCKSVRRDTPGVFDDELDKRILEADAGRGMDVEDVVEDDETGALPLQGFRCVGEEVALLDGIFL